MSWKAFCGFLGVLLGFGIGVGLVLVLGYVIVWLCVIGGAVTFIDAVKANPTDGLGILWGVVQILAGVGLFWASIILGGLSALLTFLGQFMNRAAVNMESRQTILPIQSEEIHFDDGSIKIDLLPTDSSEKK